MAERSLAHDLAEAGEAITWDWDLLPQQGAYLRSDAKYSMYSGGFACGKCVKAGSQVWMADGTKKAIESIQPGELVLSTTTDNQIVPARVRHVINSGVLPAYEVAVQTGDKVTVSDTHPFLVLSTRKKSWGHAKRVYTSYPTGTSWQPIKAIKPGSYIGVPRLVPTRTGTSRYSLKDYELLGYLLGDGGLTTGAINFTTVEPTVVERVRSLLPVGTKLTQCGDTITYRVGLDGIAATGPKVSNPVRLMLKALGLDKTSSHTKFIPKEVFNAGSTALAATLSGLFVTDGWVDKSGVGYCSVSIELATGVNQALRDLGIFARLRKRKVTYKGSVRHAYTVNITRRADLVRFAQLVPMGYKTAKLTTLIMARLEANKPSRGDGHTYDIGDLRFAHLESVKQVDARQMYDLEIDDTHNFIADGILVHNTVSLCAKVIMQLLLPGNLGYLGRLDGKALRASTMQTLYEMLPREAMSKHNDQRGFLQLKPEFGGGKLVYGDFKDLNDLKNIPLGFFAIDQTEEVPREVWDYLVGRLRRKNPILSDTGKRQYWVKGECSTKQRHFAHHGDTKCRVCGQPLPSFRETLAKTSDSPDWDILVYKNYGFGVCNPEGPSHWIFQYFPGLPGVHGDSGPGKPGYESWTATAWDGLRAGFTKPDYIADMERIYKPLPHMWDRYLEGKWVEAEGMVYPGWSRDINVVPRHMTRLDGTPILLPDTEVYEYIDHGLTAPTAVGWVAIESCLCGCDQLNYYVIDEHYEGGKPVSYHAQCIKTRRERMPYKVVAAYLDSQAFSRTLLGQKGTPREDSIYSVADEYSDHGIFCSPNQKDWDAGYNRISELLANDPKHVHPVTGIKGAPHLYVAQNCAYFIDEIEKYKWKKARNVVGQSVNEEPVDLDDHHMDGLNGFLTSRPVAFVYTPTNTDDVPAWLLELNRELGGHESHMGL